MDKNTLLNGFEVFNSFSPNVGGGSNEIESKEKVDYSLWADEELTDEELEATRNGGKEKELEEEDEGELEEELDESKSTKSNKSKDKANNKKAEAEKKVEKEEEDEEDDEQESGTISAFFGALSEKMGWETEEDEDIPLTAEELIQYFQDVIEESSTPTYANEEVAQLDEFVKNGGNIRDYFTIDADIDLSDINIEDNETNQKLVLKEFLKEKGFTNKLIEKKLIKYEDAGLLSDEAEDALEALRDIKEQKKEQLLEQLKKTALKAKEDQQAFFNSVVGEIKGLDSIRGIAIPKKDKELLLGYIFRPDTDGKTKYQKDYAKSVKNLIESAYFTMKGDTLIDSAQKQGKKKAIDSFKNSLKNNSGVSKRSQKEIKTESDDSSMWSSLARQLRVA